MLFCSTFEFGPFECGVALFDAPLPMVSAITYQIHKVETTAFRNVYELFERSDQTITPISYKHFPCI